jgi:hypothetical protein
MISHCESAVLKKTTMKKTRPSAWLLTGLLGCLLTNCGSGPGVPLDADGRHLVDSLAAQGISMQRYLIDSTCRIGRTQVLPHLVDSIRRVREREIREQIQKIPK